MLFPSSKFKLERTPQVVKRKKNLMLASFSSIMPTKGMNHLFISYLNFQFSKKTYFQHIKKQHLRYTRLLRLLIINAQIQGDNNIHSYNQSLSLDYIERK
jgi:hypothetical protein